MPVSHDSRARVCLPAALVRRLPGMHVKEFSESEAIFARAFAALEDGKKAILADVAEAAQPFVVACLARAVKERRVWVVCPDVRRQEEFASELARVAPRRALAAGMGGFCRGSAARSGNRRGATRDFRDCWHETVR